MPYKFIRESVNVPCNSAQCFNNDCGICTAEVSVSDLLPSDNTCDHYVFLNCSELLCKNNTRNGYCVLNDTRVKKDSQSCVKFEYALRNMDSFVFNNKNDLENFLMEYMDVPVIDFDEDCLRLTYCKIVYKDKMYRSFIRISKKDQELHTFRPHVSGAILIVPNNQTTLDL